MSASSNGRSLLTLARKSVLLRLPGSHQLVPGRRIVGATVRVASLAAARSLLERDPWPAPRTQSAGGSSSVCLPPSITHGIWLEVAAIIRPLAVLASVLIQCATCDTIQA